VLFPTFTFAVFFAVVLPVSWLLRPHLRAWKMFLLAASYVFYGYWDWRFIPLIMAVTITNEVFGVAIADAASVRTRKALAAAAVTVDLVVLGFFKYYGFFITSVEDRVGMDLPTLDIILPVGISFFTFQAISYVVDIHRGDTRPVGLLDFSVYLAFFPQLVAGPIVRSTEFLPQLRNGVSLESVEASKAALLIARGLFKKVVISSYLADTLVDDVFATPGEYSSLEVLAGVYGYAIQLYADFSGYTDIAIGIALLMGFKFPLNFDRPYTAVTIQDFWRRWHMTLSRWLRDYLYLPLGGNRGAPWKTYRNLFITMTLGGLWHGAAWTFVVWGMLQGMGLAVERLISSWRGEQDRPITATDIRIREIAALHTGTKAQPFRPDPTSPAPFTPLAVRRLWIGRLFTFNFVCFGWILFRSDSLSVAGDIMWRILTAWGGVSAITPMYIAVVVGALAMQFVPQIVSKAGEAAFSRLAPLVQGAALGVWIGFVVALAPSGVSPFIYFQF
jgi:alginate O-acetyltransferase complex protein AlgI